MTGPVYPHLLSQEVLGPRKRQHRDDKRSRNLRRDLEDVVHYLISFLYLLLPH